MASPKQVFYRIILSNFLLPAFLSAQKFHFQNYNVQQGLIQSQVIAITQDNFDNLWFCTLGGISRFDGKNFTNYSETDGLISNYANCILADHLSNIWIGTAYGLSRFNGTVFKNYRFSTSLNGNTVRTIKEDKQYRIWVLAGGYLYSMDQNEIPVRNPVSGMDEMISAIQVDNQGNLFAAVKDRGIFQLENSGWKLNIPLPATKEMLVCQKLVFDINDNKKLLLLTGNAILSSENGITRSLFKPGSMGKINNMFLDKSGILWFAGSQGLFQYTDSGMTAFNASNGYEGNATAAIFQDREDNIWFGTNGTGVFRYSYQPFLIFDQFTATNNTAVMPMLESQGRIYMGTDGKGLFEYDGKNIRAVNGISDSSYDQHIHGLFQGTGNEFYVLSSSGLFSKYDHGKISRVRLGALRGCIIDVRPDENGGFWVASCDGFFHISATGETKLILDIYSNKMLRIAKDSFLLGTDDGLYLIGPDIKYKKIKDSLLNTARYMSMSSLGKYYLLATSNKGLIIYNSATGKRNQYTTKDGLNADFIYSVVTDHKSRIWMGTGRGINQIVLDTVDGSVKISSLSIPGDISSAETNQEAAIYDDKNNLWVGTVSGLFKFAPDSVQKRSYLPPVVLQQVQVFSKDIPSGRFSGLQDNWYRIPKDLVLKHNENHLTFSFHTPSYLHSESILYQYQLEGMEKVWSALTPNHFVVYPSLPPGRYVFRARAYLEGLGFSKDNVAYAFDIKAAFYQTLYFKFLLLVFVMGIILWIQWMRIRMRVKRLQQIEEVKREENVKVRQSASEDFHDEVGNSLTRIQVLTDVLQTKLGNGHDEEKRIISQIKENASGLYQGTRDILWALNPESDIIKEIGHRLESLGIDVYQDTGICFSYENQLGEFENEKLPGNFNRNIMMIFKEVMSNCLKHAKARHVKLVIRKTGIREIGILLSEDGIGFNPLYIKKGHGFQNIQKRANRMNATCSIDSNPGEGSRYELRIPVLSV